MKLLHVITGLNVGGAETMLMRLLHHSSAQDQDVMVASLMPPGFVGQRLQDNGVRVHALGMTSVATALPATLRLAALVRRERPDVIMAWMHHAQLATMCATMLARTGVPVIWNVRHSLGGGYVHEKRLTRLVLRTQALLSRRPQAIIYNARVAMQQYRAIGFDPTRAMVIPNGFDLDADGQRAEAQGRLRRIFGIAPDRIVIAMVARAHPMKDAANLVSAFARLHLARMPAHLLIVGEGMDRPTPEIAEALAALPTSYWTLSGQRSDVAQWLGGVDILALPSAWGEGFPNIVGEAMAKAIPCVGTDVGDTGWVIGATGRTVPPGNPTALALALMELCHLRPEERVMLGGAARQRISEMFAIDQVVKRYDALFRQVAGRIESDEPGPSPRAMQCEAV
jgi:glycosyltransferase involved in cell wall biosynthesis